jgi:NAD(P)-dependent dehydrogenase (short-subunit alcohol dehydrogenase family)
VRAHGRVPSRCSAFFAHVSEASERLEGDTLKVVGLECDVSSEACMEKAFTRTIETFGRVDVVVASAGEFPVFHASLSRHIKALTGIVENHSALE